MFCICIFLKTQNQNRIAEYTAGGFVWDSLDLFGDIAGSQFKEQTKCHGSSDQLYLWFDDT